MHSFLVLFNIFRTDALLLLTLFFWSPSRKSVCSPKPSSVELRRIGIFSIIKEEGLVHIRLVLGDRCAVFFRENSHVIMTLFITKYIGKTQGNV